MKRFTACFLLFFIFFSLFSCAGKEKMTAFGAAEALLSDVENIPPYRIYGNDTGSSLSEADFSFLYTGTYGECPALGLIDDSCILLGQRPEIFELHIIRAKTPGDAEHIVKLLEKRRKLIEAYTYRASEDDQSDFSGTSVTLTSVGRWIVLAAMPDSETIAENAVKLLG